MKCEMFASTSRAANLFYLEVISWQVSVFVFHSGWLERLEDHLWKPTSYLPDAALRHEYDSALLPWVDLQQQLWLCSYIWGIGRTDKWFPPRVMSRVNDVKEWDSGEWQIRSKSQNLYRPTQFCWEHDSIQQNFSLFAFALWAQELLITIRWRKEGNTH